ncbi:hypothetical protein ColLi_06792 [Colletotrichum liriopes]|uniref:FAR1 domain-containing protein n=1 Tax=Colletotrichum liriopes TaxID=708192 RepID=A0AA37GMU8_9PEZI|nr:hypothetical protein ColLi_06792 [Colletotrichum liriopes]
MSTIRAPTFDECYLRVRLRYRDEGIALNYTTTARTRKTSSKRCDCPFAGKIRFLPETNEWIWGVLVGRDTHNHDPIHPSKLMSVAAFRSLSQAEAAFQAASRDVGAKKPTVVERVEQLSKTGMKSPDIASQLSEQDRIMVTAQDVRNTQQKLRHEKCGPLTST